MTGKGERLKRDRGGLRSLGASAIREKERFLSCGGSFLRDGASVL